MQLHKHFLELTCSMSLHAVPWAYMQFLSLSEPLTGTLQCLFSICNVVKARTIYSKTLSVLVFIKVSLLRRAGFCVLSYVHIPDPPRLCLRQTVQPMRAEEVPHKCSDQWLIQHGRCGHCSFSRGQTGAIILNSQPDSLLLARALLMEKQRSAILFVLCFNFKFTFNLNCTEQKNNFNNFASFPSK